MSLDKIDSVLNSKGTLFKVIREIGHGSQGSTYLLEGEKYIAKLFNEVANETKLNSTIDFLKRLNLDKEIFALPLSRISRPKIGYISEFASGMVPLTSLKWNNQSQDMEQWFVDTGGMYKRYKVLFKLAEAILMLHSRGLIYCDLSPNNVFISQERLKYHVFLIDLDNLRYRSSIINNIYTSFYGAPELVNITRSNSFESDCFSFAVIAYELLTLNHPLIGDYVSEGEPELEEEALSGKLPWVESTKDDINQRSSGLPSQYFITQGLHKLFDRTFEEGLNNPEKRPTISEWRKELNIALNELIQCPKCKVHYPYSNKGACPFCGEASSSIVTLQLQRWEKEEVYNPKKHRLEANFKLFPQVYEEIIIDKYTPKYIRKSHFLVSGKDDECLLEVKVLESNGDMKLLEIKPYHERTFYIAIDAMEMFHSNTPKRIRITGLKHKELIVGLENLSEPQRVLTIK